MHVKSIVEQPVSGLCYYRQRVPVEGWVWGDYRHDRIKRVAAYGPGGELGSTAYLFFRDDVVQAERLPPGTRTGFRFVAHFANPYIERTTVGIEVRVEFADGSYVPLSGIHIKLLEHDYTTAPYGDVANPRATAPLERGSFVAAHQPAEAADPACVSLLADYLSPGASLFDVGCGQGVYCEPLRSRGFSWIGGETGVEALHALALHSRPHRRIRTSRFGGYRLPATDKEFDAVISMHHLHRLPDPASVLPEIRRITKRQAFFAVPNGETLPFLAAQGVAPLHLLDGRARQVFSRFSLRALLQPTFRAVEVIDFGRQPLRSSDDLPLPPSLLAICDV